MLLCESLLGLGPDPLAWPRIGSYLVPGWYEILLNFLNFCLFGLFYEIVWVLKLLLKSWIIKVVETRKFVVSLVELVLDRSINILENVFFVSILCLFYLLNYRWQLIFFLVVLILMLQLHLFKIRESLKLTSPLLFLKVMIYRMQLYRFVTFRNQLVDRLEPIRLFYRHISCIV